MSDSNKAVLIWEMIELAYTVTADHDGAWRMIINGGTRQEIGQVHGHLLYDDLDHDDAGIAIEDPMTKFDAWKHLFDQAAAAQAEPGNGYSVTFRLNKTGNVEASFSESGSS